MSNKKDLLIIYFFIVIEVMILINSHEVIDSVKSSSVMFITKVFPSLFPTMVVGNILTKQGFYKVIPNFIKKIFHKLFNFNDVMTGVFITAMITGSPSNAIYIDELLEKKLLNEKEAELLLCTTHFVNPLFVIGGVGIYVFNSVKIGVLLLLTLWISNFIKVFINRKKFISSYTHKKEYKHYNIINDVTDSIKSSVNSSLLIFGIIIMFSLLVSLIGFVFNLSNTVQTVVGGLLEMTGGIMKLSNLPLNFIVKFILSYYFLNFGGLCIQMQTFGMIKNKKIRYLKYLIFRLI